MIGVGEYKFRKEFQVLQQNSDEIRIPKSYSPDEIVNAVKTNINRTLNRDETEVTENDFSAVINEIVPTKANMHCLIWDQIKDDSVHPTPILNSTESLIGTRLPSYENDHTLNESTIQKSSENIPQKNQLQIVLAREAVQNKRVELIPHMSSFVVQSSNHKTYSVQLNPRETCNCPATTTCWHIIAAKLSVGVLNTTSTKQTINLSQLK